MTMKGNDRRGDTGAGVRETAGASGPRVGLVDECDLDPRGLEVYARVAETRGSVANVFRALGSSVPALDRVAALGAFARYESVLDHRLRELVILTVAHEHGCLYEWSHHWTVAAGIPVDPSFMVVIGTPAAEKLSEPYGPVLRAARSIARGERLPDQMVAGIAGMLGERALVELVVVVGYYGLLARVIEALNVPLDDDAVASPMPSLDPSSIAGRQATE